MFRKNPRQKGLPGLSHFLVEYEIGDKVDIVANPGFARQAMPHRKFHGKTGEITGTRGKCYEVEVKFGKKAKMIIVGKEHIRLNKGYLMRRDAQQQAETA